jgi:hypothetical protein
MKILFFVDTEYPGFRGSEAEKEIIKCGVRFFVGGRGVDLVVVLVEDERQEECVFKKLYDADITYVFEMEGAPRRLRYRSVVTGRVLAEAEF